MAKEKDPNYKAAEDAYKRKFRERVKARKKEEAKKPSKEFPFIVDKDEIAKMNRAICWPQSMSKRQRYYIIEKAKRSRILGKKEAGAAVWGPIEGIGNPKFRYMLSRYEIMRYIIDMVSVGLSVPRIVEMHEDECAFPTLLEIRSWGKMHPDFEQALLEADATRGEILGEQALTVVMEAPENEDPRKTKLKHEALSKHAARLNERYQDKQVQKVEDVTDKLSREEMLKQLQSLANKHKEIADAVMPVLGGGVENDAEGNSSEGCIVDVKAEVREEGNCCVCEKPRRECVC